MACFCQRGVMCSQCGNRDQIICLFLTLFVLDISRGAASRVSVAVVYNSFEFEQLNNSLSFTLSMKESFERIPAKLGSSTEVNFVYKDINSTFCNFGKFLSFLGGILPFEFVVLLQQNCQCETKLLSYLKVTDINFISRCGMPFFAANGTSAIIQQVNKEKHKYLFVPTEAYGVEFYHELSSQLQYKKLKLYRTVWIGTESDELSQLHKVLKKLAQAMEKNMTSAATFVLGFLNPGDFRVKNLLSLAQAVFGKQFRKILWIFPLMNLDFNSMLSFPKSLRVLAFQKSNFASVYCDNTQDCRSFALRLVLEKTTHFLESCWKKDEHRRGEVLTENSQLSVAQKLEHGYRLRVKNKECKLNKPSCFFNVLQLVTDSIIGEITWKRIATWNGKKFQPNPSGKRTNTFNLRRSIRTVFRVPLVEYFPFIEKHQFRGYYTSCPVNSLPCYKQRTKADNSTVINYADKYCCTGWTVDVLLYLTDKLSHRFELYFQAENLYGIYDNKTGSWNGVIQDILSGKGDISVDLGINPGRCAELDCSLGYIFDGINAIVKLGIPDQSNEDKDSFYSLVGNFHIFLSPFHLDLLITVLMIFNAFLLLIWATDKICLSYRNKRPRKKKEKFTLLESTSYVWATAFGRDVGDSKKPVTLSARYLASWLAFLALVFVNVYVARLMAEIVKQDPIKSFTSLRDSKILNKKLKIGLVGGSSMESFFHNTPDPLLKKSFENIKEHLMSTLDAGVEAVKNGKLDGFIADTISLVAVLNQDSKCSLSLMGKDFATIPFGFMFRKDWPWADEFKLAELNMNENKRKTDLWQKRLTMTSCKALSTTHAQLGVGDMSGLFLILIFSIAYCCFSLILENISSFLWYRYRNSNAEWEVPHNRKN